MNSEQIMEAACEQERRALLQNLAQLNQDQPKENT